MSQTLIPTVESYSSTASQFVELHSGAISQSTREIAGGIVRERDLVRRDEPETVSQNNDHANSTRVCRVRLASPLIRLPAGTLPKEHVQLLQQWEGVITEVKSDSFFADLQDLADANQPIEVVEIPIEEIPNDDMALLVEGAIFYWSIGYETSAGGQLRRVSEIRMRRAPRWTKRGIQQVKKRAEELFEIYGK